MLSNFFTPGMRSRFYIKAFTILLYLFGAIAGLVFLFSRIFLTPAAMSFAEGSLLLLTMLGISSLLSAGMTLLLILTDALEWLGKRIYAFFKRAFYSGPGKMPVLKSRNVLRLQYN